MGVLSVPGVYYEWGHYITNIPFYKQYKLGGYATA